MVISAIAPKPVTRNLADCTTVNVAIASAKRNHKKQLRDIDDARAPGARSLSDAEPAEDLTEQIVGTKSSGDA